MTRRSFSAAISLASFAWLLCAAAGCHRPAPAAPVENRSAQAPAAGVQRVVAGKPERKTLRLSTVQPGRIEAFEETPLFGKLAGFVDQVLVDIGDKVMKGQTLVTISIPEMHDELEHKRALVAQAEAEVKQAQAAVAAAKAATGTAEARVEQAQAGVVAAKGERVRWDAEHARIKELAANRSVNQKVVDETLNQLKGVEGAYQAALASVRSSQAMLEEARVQVESAKADEQAAAARLLVAKAESAKVSTLLGYTTIKAPYDGVVTQRLAVTGDYFSPASASSSQPILVVCRTDLVRVFVDVPELEAASVDNGDKADVRVQALGGRSFEAAVTRNSWSLDPTNRSLRAEIDVSNPEGVLRPGMYAMATILLEERRNALALPAAAVVHEGQDAFCFVVKSGKLQRQRIELGLRSGAEFEIRSGLRPDEEVVLTKAESLHAGQSVETTAAEKKSP